MPRCALPDKIVHDPKGNEVNLKDARHWDWPWPMSYFKRAINAFGPRCEMGTKGYRAWPPTLVEGYGVARWEYKDGNNHSIIFIPQFANKRITDSVYGKTYEAVEKNQGDDKWVHVHLSKGSGYSPSALQRFSMKGYVQLSPWYISQWYKLKTVENGEDYYLFHREGYRPDHNDRYYNWGPMLGLKMD